MVVKLTVKNVGKTGRRRANKYFPKKSERTVNVRKSKIPEIEACVGLKIVKYHNDDINEKTGTNEEESSEKTGVKEPVPNLEKMTLTELKNYIKANDSLNVDYWNYKKDNQDELVAKVEKQLREYD